MLVLIMAQNTFDSVLDGSKLEGSVVALIA